MRMSGKNKEPLGLYFHVPFCTKKCPYCHFYVVPDDASAHRLLLQGFLLELEQQKPLLQNAALTSLYFGGGTPSLLDPSFFEQLFRRIGEILPFSADEIEITVEANPDSLSLEKTAALAKLGVNRMSIGVQSLDNALLHKLGRTHHAKKALEAVDIALQGGISNLSIDLMYELPGQTLDSWNRTLEQAAAMPIKHLSLYNLTIEPGTVFFKHRENLSKEVADAETCAEMYETALQTLNDSGLHQYEISAFARDGYQAQHNTGYWTGRSFLGIGPSAFSYWQGARFRNKAHLRDYWNALKQGASPVDFSEKLDSPQRQRELFTIALRLLSGVPIEQFNLLDQPTQTTIHKLIEAGWLQKNDGHIRLTKRGILFYDSIASDLI